MDLADLTFIVGDYNSKNDADDLGDFQAMILQNFIPRFSFSWLCRIAGQPKP